MWLSFENVTKFYGAVIGVNDVSFRVGPGITALFGSNGAGKSTLLKLASGQLRPSLGSVRIGENSAWSTAAKRNFGYSPDINQFYEEMTGRKFVYTMARLSGQSRSYARARTEEVLKIVGMSDRADRRIAGFSHGMRQRTKLAQALVHDPEILLLDEPMTGIDPAGRREFNEVLKHLADQGKTILVSSHLLSEVELLTENMLMIARGRVVASGSVSEIRQLLESQPLAVGLASDRPRELAQRLIAMSEVHSIDVRDDMLTARVKQPRQFFANLGELAAAGEIDIQRLETLDAGAEAVFGYLQSGVNR